VKNDLVLSAVSREDTGHAIFHANAGINVACGSCHLEGGDDGRVWEIDKERRRTPSLKGTIAGTAPYHWEGDMASIHALLADVYAVRMNGGPLKADQSTAATSWIASIPPPPPALPGQADTKPPTILDVPVDMAWAALDIPASEAAHTQESDSA
jgi:hypothetical protein